MSKKRYIQPLPSVPQHGNEALRGYYRPKVVYDEVCSTCRNQREILSIKGVWEPCARCR